MNKEPNILEIIIGLLSVMIFIYRTVVIMLPMLNTGIKEKNYTKVLNSFTLLV
tara:strand:+ start:1743 stop:1901 length:159 start_codon:yes stop_codon:yes gene_type:complete